MVFSAVVLGLAFILPMCSTFCIYYLIRLDIAKVSANLTPKESDVSRRDRVEGNEENKEFLTYFLRAHLTLHTSRSGFWRSFYLSFSAGTEICQWSWAEELPPSFYS